MKDIQKLVVGLVPVALTLGISFAILEKFQSGMDTNSTGYVAVSKVMEALLQVPDWLPMIVLVTIAVILMALVRYFSRAAEE